MMSYSKEIDEYITSDTIAAEINSYRNDEQIDLISLTYQNQHQNLQNTIE